MAFTQKSDRSLLASLGIAFFVLTGIFAVLAINFRSKETTELRSRANFDQNPYLTPSPKISPTVSPLSDCKFAYRGNCYEDQIAVNMAKSNYERSQMVKCYIPNPLCPPAVEQPTPIKPCPYQYGDHCYASQSDANDAKYNATKSITQPAVEAPVPIDQN